MKARKGKSKPKAREAVLRHDRDGYLRCRVCSCTVQEPCNPPCGWADGEPDLCSNSAGLVLAVVAWLDGAHHPSFAALRREVAAVIAAGVEA